MLDGLSLKGKRCKYMYMWVNKCIYNNVELIRIPTATCRLDKKNYFIRGIREVTGFIINVTRDPAFNKKPSSCLHFFFKRQQDIDEYYCQKLLFISL